MNKGDETLAVLAVLGFKLSDLQKGAVRSAVALECCRAELAEAKRMRKNERERKLKAKEKRA